MFTRFPSVWLRVALETLDRLTESLDFTDYASRIIHPIVRTLDSTPELRGTSMDTLSSLVFQLGKKVAAVVPQGSRLNVTTLQKSTSRLPAAALHASTVPVTLHPAPVLITGTSCQTADVIDHLAAGGWRFTRVDEVMFTPPPKPCPPLSIKPSYGFQA